MEKSLRLMALIMTINQKRKFKVKDLAEEFGVSQRTILRDLQELGEIGVPLFSETGRHGGYQVLNDAVLPPISFTEQEALSMFFAYQSLLMYTSLPFEAQYASALKKFYYNSSDLVKARIDKMKDRIVFWIPQRPLPTPCLGAVLEAAIDQKVVSITYDSEQGISERDILPIGIYTAQGLWYCPAYCFKSREYRLFRVDRMMSCGIKKEQSPLPEPVLTLKTWFASNSSENVQLLMRVKLTRKGMRKLETQYWKPDELQSLDDGTGILKARIDERDISFCAHLFLGYGTDAEVLEPESLRNEIRRELEDIEKLYK